MLAIAAVASTAVVLEGACMVAVVVVKNVKMMDGLRRW